MARDLAGVGFVLSSCLIVKYSILRYSIGGLSTPYSGTVQVGFSWALCSHLATVKYSILRYSTTSNSSYCVILTGLNGKATQLVCLRAVDLDLTSTSRLFFQVNDAAD